MVMAILKKLPEDHQGMPEACLDRSCIIHIRICKIFIEINIEINMFHRSIWQANDAYDTTLACTHNIIISSSKHRCYGNA